MNVAMNLSHNIVVTLSQKITPSLNKKKLVMMMTKEIKMEFIPMDTNCTTGAVMSIGTAVIVVDEVIVSLEWCTRQYDL